ncbi:unnamed protein product [Cercospora beticola]|nr:unnamed protein product [Cercospora beticola]
MFLLANRAPISWRSILQKSVALSSCESEYMALKEATKEAIFLKDLLKELGLEDRAITVYTDSNSAIELANNPEHYAKSKHIDIQYNFVRDSNENGLIKLVWISTKEQKAYYSLRMLKKEALFAITRLRGQIRDFSTFSTRYGFNIKDNSGIVRMNYPSL